MRGYFDLRAWQVVVWVQVEENAQEQQIRHVQTVQHLLALRVVGHSIYRG